MDTLQAIKQRISANKFDTSRALNEAEVKELVDYATEAPSAYNLQHARFIAVTSTEAKEKLKAAAYGQQKVADAAVTFIVLGDLQAHEKLPDIMARSVKAGVVPQAVADYIVNGAAGFYGQYENTQLVRDEAIRSASFAAMTLMLAAEAKGLVSGPMIGFAPDAVKAAFHIEDRYLPVMLLTVGYSAPGNWPRKPRLEVEEVLRFNEGLPA